MRRKSEGDRPHLLRLHGQYHHLGTGHRTLIVGCRSDAVVAQQALELLAAWIGDDDALPRKTALGQASDKRGRHIAAADECQSTYIVHASLVCKYVYSVTGCRKEPFRSA